MDVEAMTAALAEAKRHLRWRYVLSGAGSSGRHPSLCPLHGCVDSAL